MNRRDFLKTGLGALTVTLPGCALIPVLPKRPEPDSQSAMGWISYLDGRYELVLPRIEMGQDITTALKQIACEELEIGWRELIVQAQSTRRITRVRSTVGSESIQYFLLPLARACATLRLARDAGQAGRVLEARDIPTGDLRTFTGSRHVGKAAPKVDDEKIVTGQPLYASDIRVADMVHGRVLRAPFSPDRPTSPQSWDTAAARKIPGFLAVLPGEYPGHVGASQGLGILAETPGALDRIEAALAIKWESGDMAAAADTVDVDREIRRGEAAHTLVDGTPDAGAGWDLDMRLDIPAAPHGALEPRAAVAQPTADGGLTLWAGSQDLFFLHDYLARAFSLDPGGIDIRACRVGGGFGSRTVCTVEAEATALALAAKRPVRVQWTRTQEYRYAFHRPPVSHRLRARLKEGRIDAWHHRFAGSHILLTNAALDPWLQGLAETFAGDKGTARGAVPPYATGETRVEFDLARLPVLTGPWRGLGAGPNGLAVEVAIDLLAQKAGRDPLDFRMDHAWDSRLVRVLQEVAARADWRNPLPAAPAGFRRGRGLGCGIYKGVSYAAVVAEVEIDQEGMIRVTRVICAHDCGKVINPDGLRAQCEGNILWSLGLVLSDRLTMEGEIPSATSFWDAPIPRMSDAPEIEVTLVDRADPPSGGGETVMAAAPGAIANAIRAATGNRPTVLPLRV